MRLLQGDEFVQHRETRLNWTSERKVRPIIAFDSGLWVSTRGDHLARSDLGVDVSTKPCSICGGRHGTAIWLSMLPTHEVRCRACWMPSGDVVTYVQIKVRGGKVVGQRVAMLR